MFISYQQADVVTDEKSRIPSFQMVSIFCGVGGGLLFAFLWPGFQGLAAWAVWPLGFAAGILVTVFGASLFARQMHWDMLIVGKAFALVGTLMFFVSSLF